MLLQRFKLTQELDMAVFEQASLLDHCDLFVSSGTKPGDALESLEEELEPDEGEAVYGQQPENV